MSSKKAEETKIETPKVATNVSGIIQSSKKEEVVASIKEEKKVSGALNNEEPKKLVVNALF